MTTKKRYWCTLALLCCMAASAGGQALHSAYWLERMPNRYTLNPALGIDNDFGFLAMPALGSVDVELRTSVGIASFLQLSADKSTLIGLWDKNFSGSVPRNFRNSTSLDLPLIAFGFYAFGGFNTFDVEVHNRTSLAIGDGVFSLAQSGVGRQRYDMDFSVGSQTYISAGIGRAQNISDRWAFGVRVKFLAGAANIDAQGHAMLDFSDSTALHIDAQGKANIMGFENMITDSMTFNSPSLHGLPGWGLGADVGLTVKPHDDVTLALSLTDIGFLRWQRNSAATFRNLKTTIRYNDLLHQYIDDESMGLDSVAKIGTTIEPSTGGTSWLQATLRFGVEYNPHQLNNKLSLGLLWTTRFGHITTWTELMASANIKPLSWLQLSLTGAVYSFGSTPAFSWGAVLNVAPRHFLNFFVGAESLSFSKYGVYNRVPIPLGRISAHVNAGLNIPLNRNRYKSERKLKIPPPDTLQAKPEADSLRIDSLRIDSLRIDSISANADSAAAKPKPAPVAKPKLTREELLRRAMEDEQRSGDAPKPKAKKPAKKPSKADLLKKAMEDEQRSGDAPKPKAKKPARPTKAELLKRAMEEEARENEKLKRKN